MNIFRFRNTPVLLAILVSISAMASPAPGATPLRPADAKKTAIMTDVKKMEGLTPEQFKALPDDAVIEIKGRKTTMKKLRAGMETSLRRMMADMNSKSKSTLDAKRSAFLAEQNSKLEANNARGKAAMTQAPADKGQYEKIRAEAIQMNSRYASASPAEKSKMDQRAGELMAELNKLGY